MVIWGIVYYCFTIIKRIDRIAGKCMFMPLRQSQLDPLMNYYIQFFFMAL